MVTENKKNSNESHLFSKEDIAAYHEKHEATIVESLVTSKKQDSNQTTFSKEDIATYHDKHEDTIVESLVTSKIQSIREQSLTSQTDKITPKNK
jgi:hypothetical protein